MGARGAGGILSYWVLSNCADDWITQTVNELGLQHTVRPEGQPSKASQLADEMAKSQRVRSGNAKRKST